LKNIFFTALFIPVMFLSGCQTIVLSLSNHETYSLEREGDVWRINHDSEYYRYFNKIQQTYSLLLKDAKDPEEIRRLYIERDLLIARRRLEHMADPRLVKEVVNATKRGLGTNPTGHLFRMNDVENVPRQKFTPADPSTYTYKDATPAFWYASSDAITSIIQFDRQLKKRGVALIAVPVPNAVQLYTHMLHPDIHLEDVIWHPWAQMIVKLLENDVEVIDLLDLYKAYNGDNTALNYIDHHWGEAGMDIVSWELAQRLKRFKFDDQYYLDPAFIKKVPITVDTPAMIPHWDHIDVNFIAGSMPYNPKYQTVRITYKDQIIHPVRSFEDSPVLLMGDSFLPHAEATSSGIYAHFAYHTRIIPAAFSRDAGTCDAPETYRRSVAGQGKEPKVVIWEMYGSIFSETSQQNNWKVVNMPDPVNAPSDPARRTMINDRPVMAQEGLTVTPDRKLEWVAGEAIQVSEIPKLKKLDYPDALYAYKVRVTDKLSSRLKTGDIIVVYSQFMEQFKIKEEKILKKGDKAYFYLEKWTPAAQKTEKIGTMQLVDDLEDYESDIYFNHFQSAHPNTQLTKLNKTYLEKGAAADGAVDKDGNPVESLAFKLDRMGLIESIKIGLRHDKAKPALFAIETSLDGKNWFSLYQCRSTGGDRDVKVITLESAHPALYVRLTGPAVKKEIAFDNTPNNPGDFSGIEIYGY
jgi:hypothetical protein